MAIGRGPKAKSGGKVIEKGLVMPFTVYLRPKTKALLLRAANKAKRKVANFVVLAALEKIAAESGKSLDKLLPAAEYGALVLKKYAYTESDSRKSADGKGTCLPG